MCDVLALMPPTFVDLTPLDLDDELPAPGDDESLDVLTPELDSAVYEPSAP